MAAHEYELSIDLNALNHLGINLYSNMPAVISEVVAISWDNKKETIAISDDGVGMSKDDINQRYLKVGYRKRDEMIRTPKFKRHVMGRKGIGKLSLFSIADTIEVRSAKKPPTGSATRSGFIMNGPAIARAIEQGEPGAKYYPEPIKKKQIKISKGTEITLRDLKKDVSRSETFLRRRLARRFGIIGDEFKFHVWV